MALTKDQKAAQISDLKEKMARSQSMIFAHYIGMSVAEASDFRAKLKEANAEMKVAKKTLMQIAAKDLEMPELQEDVLEGPVACIFSYEDPMTGAQVAFKFAKTHPQVALIGGIFDGKLMNKEEAIAFAKMPNREQLLGMFVSMIQSPLRNFASMSNGPLTSFARGLGELAKQKA